MRAGAFKSLHRKLKDLEREAGVESCRFGEAGEVIFISCAEIGFPDTVVETTSTPMVTTLNDDKGNELLAQRVFDGTLRNFTRIKKEGNFEKMYMENGQAWKDFCDDACLHFIARSSLHGKGIPLVRKKDIQDTPMQPRDPI